MLDRLNKLLSVPMEEWRSHGFKFKAVSANAHGIVNSGILSNGTYFYRKWNQGFTESFFVLG